MYREKIKQAYESVRGESYTYIDDVRKASGLSEDIFHLCIKALSQVGVIELQPGYEQWNNEKQAYQVGNDTFYGMTWLDTTDDKPAKESTVKTAFERLFERVNEITVIMECTREKKQAVRIIKSELPEFADMSDNTIKTNITAFPFLCSQMTESDDTIKQELNTALNNFEAVKQELTEARQEVERFKQESDNLKQELNITLNNLEMVKQDTDRKDKGLTELNNQLNKVGDMDRLEQFIQQTEQRFVELNNRIKQLEIAKTEVKQIKQAIKQRGLNNVGKWNIVESGGYYRAFRNIDGKNQGVYIGKVFTEEIARQKIETKGFTVD